MTIAEVLSRHHRRFDELFAQIDSEMGTGDRASALYRLAHFRAELERHMQIEEKLLFPAFEKANEDTPSSFAEVRSEHVELRELVDEIERAIASGDGTAYESAATALVILMGQHHHKEECALYPMCNATLAAAQELADRIRRELGEP